MPKVTKTNYFTSNNKTLTNSKIGDFIKDPHFFFRKHVLAEIPSEISDPLVIGSAVDCWLTEKESEFRKKYYVVTRRNKKLDDYRYQLTPTIMKEVEGICRRVEATTAFKQIKGYTAQRILQVERDDLGEHFDKLAGIPDWYKVIGDRATIIDLKTSRTANPKKYHYHCEDYGYYRQQALYQYLIMQNYPEVKFVESFHLVVEKDSDSIYPVRTFKINQHRIEEEFNTIGLAIGAIRKERAFQPQDCDFETAIEIGKLTEEF